MGCCMSHFDKETVYEVTLDADGVAQRVPKGQGTHFIHVSANNETHLEEKVDQTGSRTPPVYSSKRIHPVASPTTEKEEQQEEQK